MEKMIKSFAVLLLFFLFDHTGFLSAVLSEAKIQGKAQNPLIDTQTLAPSTNLARKRTSGDDGSVTQIPSNSVSGTMPKSNYIREEKDNGEDDDLKIFIDTSAFDQPAGIFTFPQNRVCIFDDPSLNEIVRKTALQLKLKIWGASPSEWSRFEEELFQLFTFLKSHIPEKNLEKVLTGIKAFYTSISMRPRAKFLAILFSPTVIRGLYACWPSEQSLFKGLNDNLEKAEKTQRKIEIILESCSALLETLQSECQFSDNPDDLLRIKQTCLEHPEMYVLFAVSKILQKAERNLLFSLKKCLFYTTDFIGPLCEQAVKILDFFYEMEGIWLLPGIDSEIDSAEQNVRDFDKFKELVMKAYEEAKAKDKPSQPLMDQLIGFYVSMKTL